MGRRKKKILESVLITGIADKGKAVGRDPEGQVVFVDGAVPGDEVKVLIKRKRNGYMEGQVLDFVSYADHRVKPFCEHFDSCGGCKWQHLSYEKQLEYKEQVVRDAIRRIAKLEPETFYNILGCEETSYYRNKMEFSFSSKKWLPPEMLNTDISNVEDVCGFHPPRAYDKIIHINHCHLQYEPSNKIRNTVFQIAKDQGYTFHDAKVKTGFMRNMFVRISTLGQIMVTVVVGENDVEKVEKFMAIIMEQLPEITCLYYCINEKVNDYILDLPIIHYTGPTYIEEKMGEVLFRIGSKSFFQTNTRQGTKLFDKVVEFAQFTGSENVYDLYCGIGSIALFMAKQVKQVVGVEEIAAAIEDAKVNAQINDIENAIFYAGDVKDVVTAEFAAEHGAPDVVITDPPRAGMHAKMVAMLLELAAPKIIYVSCNPATQARDLQLLSEKYILEKIQPVDMFPQTHHIETVALLRLK